MTCVVGLVKSGKIYMGSDSAAVDVVGGHIFAQKSPKVFMVGQYGIAFTDSFRMGQILQYNWIPPKFTGNSRTLDKFMRTKFVESVKEAFKAGGYGNIGNQSEAEDSGGIFLIGVKGTGRLFYMDDDFQIGENIVPYYAERYRNGLCPRLTAFYSINERSIQKVRDSTSLSITIFNRRMPTISLYRTLGY